MLPRERGRESLAVVRRTTWKIRFRQSLPTPYRSIHHSSPHDAAMTPKPDTTQAPFPNYLLAEDDVAFLKRPELRPVRLQLELLKPEILLEEHGIASTLVVFGGTQIVERPIA